MSQGSSNKRTIRIPCRVFENTNRPAQTVVLEPGQKLVVDVCAREAEGVRWAETALISALDLLEQISHEIVAKSRLKMRPNDLARWSFKPIDHGQSYVSMTGVDPESGAEKWVLFLNVEVE